MCAVWSALGGAVAIVFRMTYMGALPMSLLFVAGIIVIWLYQNVLGSYLEPYVGPLINPVMKSICSKLDPYIGQYVPGISSYASKADSSSCCSGSTACSETVPKAEEQSIAVNVTKRRVKKAD